MTTHQSPQFCANCFAGTLRGDVIPSGTVETIASLPTYVTQPEAGQTPIGVVVLISDAMGWELLNTRALADAYAKRIPAVVLVPEFMDGTRIHFSFSADRPASLQQSRPPRGRSGTSNPN